MTQDVTARSASRIASLDLRDEVRPLNELMILPSAGPITYVNLTAAKLWNQLVCLPHGNPAAVMQKVARRYQNLRETSWL